jgi:hypothetical protein
MLSGYNSQSPIVRQFLISIALPVLFWISPAALTFVYSHSACCLALVSLGLDFLGMDFRFASCQQVPWTFTSLRSASAMDFRFASFLSLGCPYFIGQAPWLTFHRSTVFFFVSSWHRTGIGRSRHRLNFVNSVIILTVRWTHVVGQLLYPIGYRLHMDDKGNTNLSMPVVPYFWV